MHYFTIRDIENLSGIKAHTWRIWEHRYNLCLPQRKESKHRFYDNDNLKQILRISYLYHSGVKISKIASLNDQQIIDALQHEPEQTSDAYYIKELMEASIDFDNERFELNCKKIFDSADFETAVTRIIYPYLEKIGMLWLTDHIIPAQEHFSSNMIRQKFAVAIDALPTVKSDGNSLTVLFTPDKEHHELPLLFMQYLMKKAGKRVFYFGSNVSISKLKSFAADHYFTHLHFHLVTNLTNKDAQQYLQNVAKEFRDKQIIMSGAEVQHVYERPQNVTLLHSLDEMVNYAKRSQQTAAIS